MGRRAREIRAVRKGGMVVVSREPLSSAVVQRAIQARCQHPTGEWAAWSPADAEQSIGHRFEQQAARDPDRIAVRTPGLDLTYTALNARANRIARALRDASGAAAEPVGMLFANDAWFTAALVGVSKAGHIQASLDRGLPPEQLRSMLQVAEARVILTDAEHAELARDLAGGRGRVVDVDQLAGSPGDPRRAVSPDAIAAVNFSSGSTGTPKGIAYSHRGLLHAVMRHVNAFRLCADDRQTHVRATTTPPLYALLVGGTYCPVDLRRLGVDQLGPWLARAGVTVYRSAVSAFRVLTDTLTGAERFPDLRLLLVFGEAAFHTDVERYRRHFGAPALFATSLGCRETGDYAYFFADAVSPLTPGALPGGYVPEHMDVVILGDDGQPVPPDDPGEIAVRSPYSATGYWKRPDLTAAAFVSDPAGSDVPVYRTADLGRRDADGCVFHLGRRDFQVKIRGHRVDTSEIETALLQIDGVRAAAVVGREDTPGDARLVAYLVPGERPLPPVRELRRSLAAWLPDYMVPTAFVPLASLPLTGTGKVDRRALPRPPARRSDGEVPAAPRTPVEAAVAAIWADVLGLEAVGVDEPFLDLGGNSVLAARIVARIHEALEVYPSLRTLLAASTVAEMALAITGAAAQQVGEPELARMLAEVEQPDGRRAAGAPGGTDASDRAR